MNLTGTTAKVELTASADLTSVNTVGSATIGTSQTAIPYTLDPDFAYSLRMQIAESTTLQLNMVTGEVTGQTSGTAQVETLTAAGTVGTSGNAKITVTGAEIVGSPLEVVFAVTAGDTAAVWAGKARTALDSVSAIYDKYTVGGASTSIVLTQISNTGNDPSLSMASANVTSTGITPATSANTTAGVIPSQAYRLTGQAWDQTDFQGEPLPASMGFIHSVLLRAEPITGTPQLSISSSLSDVVTYQVPLTVLHINPAGQLTPWVDLVDFLAVAGDMLVTIDIQGRSVT